MSTYGHLTTLPCIIILAAYKSPLSELTLSLGVNYEEQVGELPFCFLGGLHSCTHSGLHEGGIY